MYFPRRRILFLVLFLLTGLASVVPLTSTAQNTSVQRLRIRVENPRLRSGDETKVIVEFLDMNYNQVANDAKREIVIGQLGAGAKQTGGGYLKPDRLWVQPGEWSGYTTFVSKQSGRVFITAESNGLQSARTLVLITQQAASFLSRLFETVAYADDEEPFVLSANRNIAKANDKDIATCQVSFTKIPPVGTILKISTTNLFNGRIMYKGEDKGSPVAAIKVEENDKIAKTGITDDIQIASSTPGKINVVASVEGRFSDQIELVFEAPRPSKLLFDDVPKAIASDAAEVCVTARLYDASATAVNADHDQNITFVATKDVDKIRFEPKSVKILAGQEFAETRLKLLGLPSGNRVSIMASSDSGIQSTPEKSIPIQSFIHKLLVTGPREITRGQEAEFAIQLTKEDGSHCEADLDRMIDLSIDGGTLAQTRLTIGKGNLQGFIKFTAPNETGHYTLTAFSSDIVKGDFPFTVVYPAYLLILFALLGSVIGGIARQIQDASCKRLAPRLVQAQGDDKLKVWLRWIVGSLVGGIFFYWAIKLGVARVLSMPALPDTLDLGSRTTAIFFGGIGGFAGTIVLDLLASGFIPSLKRQPDKQPSAPAVS